MDIRPLPTHLLKRKQNWVIQQMLLAHKKIYSSHTKHPIWRENHPDKALGPVRITSWSPGREGKRRGWWWQSCKPLVPATIRWRLNQLYSEVSCRVSLIDVCRPVWDTVLLSPLQQTLQGCEAKSSHRFCCWLKNFTEVYQFQSPVFPKQW